MRRGTLLAMMLLFGAQGAHAAVGKVAYVMGEVWIERHGEQTPAQFGMPLERRDIVVTGEVGRAKLVMRDGTKIYVGARSRIEVAKYVKRESRLFAALNMFWGRARFFVHKLTGGEFSVRTTTAVLGVRGTSFLVTTPRPSNMDEIRKKGLHRDFDRFREAVKLPTRVVLHTGRLLVQTTRGTRVELSPGRAANVTPKGEVKVGRAEKKTTTPAPAPQPAGKGGESGKGGKPGKKKEGKPAGARGKETRPAGGKVSGKEGKKKPEGAGKGAQPMSGGAAGGGVAGPGAVAPTPKAPPPPASSPVSAGGVRAPAPPAPPVRQAPVKDVRQTVTNTKLELGPNTKATVRFQGFVQP